MDDSPDKLRRNVMLICCIIISIVMFDFKIEPSGSFLSVIKIGNISPIKLWLSLSTLLIYFFLRYIYSDQITTDTKRMKKDYAQLRLKSTYKLITKQIKRYLNTGKQPSYLIKALPPLNLRQIHLTEKPKKFRVSFTEVENYSNGAIKLTYRKATEQLGRPHTVETLNNLTFVIPKKNQALAFASTIARTATISKSSVDLITPIFLSAISFIVCIYNITNLLRV